MFGDVGQKKITYHNYVLISDCSFRFRLFSILSFHFTIMQNINSKNVMYTCTFLKWNFLVSKDGIFPSFQWHAIWLWHKINEDVDSSPHCGARGFNCTGGGCRKKKAAIHPFVSDSEGKESKRAICLFGCAMVSGRKVVVNAGFRSQSSSCVYFGDWTAKLCLHLHGCVMFVFV